MFNLFKRKQKRESSILFEDLDGNPLSEGDIVEALRYELGKSKIIKEEGELYYQSIEKGDKVSYIKMIDAATKRQKVYKEI